MKICYERECAQDAHSTATTRTERNGACGMFHIRVSCIVRKYIIVQLVHWLARPRTRPRKIIYEKTQQNEQEKMEKRLHNLP